MTTTARSSAGGDAPRRPSAPSSRPPRSRTTAASSSTSARTDGEPASVEAGRVGRAHGLDGSFYVLQPLVELLDRGRSLVVEGTRREVVRRAGTDAKPLVKLEGVDDRTAAEALRDAPLLVPVEEAPPLEEGEFWAQDLLGLRVVDGAVEVGVVRRLVGGPSCEVLAVERPGRAELLVPLVRDCVRSIDLDAGQVDVSLAFLGEGT